MALKNRELRRLLESHLLPDLEECDLLLSGDTDLIALRNHLLLGINFQISRFGDSITANIYVKPLYWPTSDGLGMSDRIGAFIRRGDTWWDLDRPERASVKLKQMAEELNRHVLPLFRELRDEKAVVAAIFGRVSGPLLSFNEVMLVGDRGDRAALGYIAAWNGNRLLAGVLLGGVGRELTQWPELNAERAHVRRTLSLLGRPGELRPFLEDTAQAQRRELKLERAKSVASILT